MTISLFNVSKFLKEAEPGDQIVRYDGIYSIKAVDRKHKMIVAFELTADRFDSECTFTLADLIGAEWSK